ncbi:isocitrate lyase/phosphoenolpyruvate mutase family protein [Nocardia sp. CDC153]|uniref:isocitrate lyase/phosphoenolpyruvate mutase family protein n=1 Tax=Nocardia sp. CDC153 TaxID=3112167 RepID=UPI002DBDB253|nr:isocitrate lyase/phosphoenolpyruvate mutase family protein [Nocardia sp. CDC153]MEC3952777.1 isocitrate lyase/phosphoenolpyruvate mutase family protein [Nocardia sp. CDC153]
MTRSTLRDSLRAGNRLRLIGAHDGLSALLAERFGFDGTWASGLGISAVHGLPDEGLLTMTEFHAAAVQMRQASSLPIVADVDSGFGDYPVVRRMVRLYEEAGIDAVCIEDKQFPKRNSFQDGNHLEHPDIAVRRIETAKRAQRGDDFMVIARQESMIAGAGLDDAVARAHRYREAGADALLIHSRREDPAEVADYCARVRAEGIRLPLVCIPTTYHSTTADQLWSYGISAVVYANQLVRASTRAMELVLESLSAVGSTSEMEPRIASLGELFALVGMDQPATTP